MDFTLTLVRHGESEANVRHMLSGWMDVELTARGIEELKRLRTEALYPQSDAYFSSSLKRCIDTCHMLFPDVKPVISDIYKEINFHSLEGWVFSTKDEIDSYFESWIEDEPYLDEETLSDVKERGMNAIMKTVHDCEGKGMHSATIVMHSGIMRASIVALFRLERKVFLEMSVPNGLGYILSFKDSSPVSFCPIPVK